MRPLLERLGLEASSEVIKAIQQATDFEAITGRPRGTEGEGIVRKGALGEWVEVLNEEEKDRAWSIAQHALTQLGYSQDGSREPLPVALSRGATYQ